MVVHLGNGERPVEYNEVEAVGEIAEPTAYTSHQFAVDDDPSFRETVLLGSLAHHFPEREGLSRLDDKSVDA